MQKIVTITLNPAIDKSTSIDALAPEKKLKCSLPKFEPGGGGINVSRALNKLGVDSTAIYLAGGYTGMFFKDLLKKEISSEIMLEISGHTRENLIVFDQTSSLQYRFGMPGPVILEKEWKNIINAIEKLDDTNYIIASGSVPEGVPKDIFAQIAVIAKKKNIKLILDTCGEALRLAINEGAYLIKPNLNELSFLSNKEELSMEAAVIAAKELIVNGKSELIIVSMGANGALMVSKEECIHLMPPEVKRISTVGAGDSMVAGIVKSLSENKSFKDAAKYGVACGSAATINPGTELCKKSDADQIYKQIREIKIN